MRLGDFTDLAKMYVHRVGYSDVILKALYEHLECNLEGTIVADVGAGTGKLTEGLISLGLKGYAIEPNQAMREEGVRLIGNGSFRWLTGTAESTSLPDKSVNWILMGSSFHWTEPEVALKEFHRVLTPGGAFTAIWNPRDLEACPLQQEIQALIQAQIPNFTRVSSGAKEYTKDIEKKLAYGGYFATPLFMEASHSVKMSKERYLNAWRSVNDIRTQAGEELFEKILESICERLKDVDTLDVPYKTRAWTVKAK